MLALTRDSLLIQQRLDAEYAARCAQFTALLAQTPPAVRSLLMPMVPTRLVVKEHDITCRLRIQTSRSIGFELGIKALNLGMAVLYGTTATEEATLSVEVRSVFTPDTVTT